MRGVQRVRPGQTVDPKPISAEAPAAAAPTPLKPISAEIRRPPRRIRSPPSAARRSAAPKPALAKPQPPLGAAAAERRG